MNLTDLGLAFLRISASLMMLISHGLPKLMGYSKISGVFPDPLGVGNSASLMLAIFGELICPAFIALGLKTRLASIPLAVTMFVAAFGVHWADPWKKKEFALIYGVIFIATAISGGGKYSVDRLMGKK